MLVIKDLSLYIKQDLRMILENFDFSLYKGQKVALIGEEGNGKSSLLKAIADPSLVSGYMEVSGDIFKAYEVIGYLPQVLNKKLLEVTTFDYFQSKVNWSLFDYTKFYNLLDKMNFLESRISELILIRNLSGGEKIKFLLLCEMIKNPTILLLDEPSNDLDLSSVRWLEKFINDQSIPIMFVSHDELLLERCANTIIHIEQLMRKSKPHYTIAGQRYSEYVLNRENRIEKQTQLALKEKEEYSRKMEKYRHIYERVQHDIRAVTRQAPSTAKNLKDKMHSVKSMGRRFEKQKENMTEKPDCEDSILVKFGSDLSVPKGKVILDLKLDELSVGELLLSRGVKLNVAGPQKICIVGANGWGKTTLLRVILKQLKQVNVPIGYMPQEYMEMMNPDDSAIEFLRKENTKEETTRVRTCLGSMNFTPEEMLHSVKSLSGGQRAKLYFSKMILDRAQVLVLDEPTRNLSPLSGPEIRKALRDYKGCILAVSHDRKFISEVCDTIYYLDQDGLREVSKHEIMEDRW